jgi:hypothetical protein
MLLLDAGLLVYDVTVEVRERCSVGCDVPAVQTHMTLSYNGYRSA